MKKLLLALLLLVLFCTCKKDNYANLCGGSNPIKNLSWLKVNIANRDSNLLNITRGAYNGQTYYFFNLYCCTACSCFPGPVYNCDGNIIRFSGNQYQEIQTSDQFINSKQMIWQK